MKNNKLLVLLSVILIIGFLATSLISFYISKNSIRNSVIRNELPLTADNIYSEIQKDLVRPVFVSKMMATDRFLRDWVISGERDESQVTNYLRDIQINTKAYVSYFISDTTHKYYYGKEKTRTISKNKPEDAWYFRIRELEQDYVLDVGKDANLSDAYVVFVDYKMFDDAGKYIGLTGIGISLDYLKELISRYQARYQRNVYFIDADGLVMLSDDKNKLRGSNIKTLLGEAYFKKILTKETNPATEFNDDYEYEHKGINYLLNLRYIPELKLYLAVEKSEELATSGIRKTLLVNLGLCAIITALALALTQTAIRRYQKQIEHLATTDSLTNLPNRTAFDVAIASMMNDSKRSKTPLSLVLFDLDNFKQINDEYGHNAGDLVLKEVAHELQGQVRQADFFCRWGGEEFLILLKNCDNAHAVILAENFRSALEAMHFSYQNQSIKLTSSFGVATLKDEELIEHLVSRADVCLYQAKAQGRNQVIASIE